MNHTQAPGFCSFAQQVLSLTTCDLIGPLRTYCTYETLYVSLAAYVALKCMSVSCYRASNWRLISWWFISSMDVPNSGINCVRRLVDGLHTETLILWEILCNFLLCNHVSRPLFAEKKWVMYKNKIFNLCDSLVSFRHKNKQTKKKPQNTKDHVLETLPTSLSKST